MMKSIDSFTAHHLLYFITVLYISVWFYVQLRFVSWSNKRIIIIINCLHSLHTGSYVAA